MSLDQDRARPSEPVDKRSAFRESLGGRRLITIADGAVMLGNCSVRTLERWHKFNPAFPRFVYINNRRYLDVDELQQFIAESQCAPLAATEV